MNQLSIGFLGAGRVAKILVQAWNRDGGPPGRLVIYDPEGDRASALGSLAPGAAVLAASPEEAAGADVVLAGVHPPVLLGLLSQVRTSVKPGALVVSLAPKHPIAALQEALGGHAGVARVNPSAPGLVGAGLNPWCASAETTPEQEALLLRLFGPLGTVRRVAEPKIEAYALVSAMGPTYFWFQWKLLADLGAEFGLDPEEAASTVEEMVHGAVRTLFGSGLTADEVQDLVPVKPLGDQEDRIRSLYREKLPPLFAKIQP